MLIFPAIDIKDKKVVRLTKGDYDKVTIYSENPVEIARSFAAAGAKCMHVVDLDGAKDGELVNSDIIEKIVSSSGLFVEIGGGIRTRERIERYLDAGAGRVILGTAAVENPRFLREAVDKFGDKIAVGVDETGGFVAVDGWKTVTDIPALEFCKKLEAEGVGTIIFTDISKDGLMEGTNLEIYGELSEIKGLDVVASGGITYLDEISRLRSMGIYGAVLGKALYEGKLSLADALKAAKE